MKKMLCLALSLMMLLSISAVAATEQGIRAYLKSQVLPLF